MIKELSQKIEGISIGADVIVGFPGEKEDDFEKTCTFVQSIPLAYLHVFSYSDRRGTIASQMSDKIPPQRIKIRSKLRRELNNISGWKNPTPDRILKRWDSRLSEVFSLLPNWFRDDLQKMLYQKTKERK